MDEKYMFLQEDEKKLYKIEKDFEINGLIILLQLMKQQ
jgi:hypothetical protein